MVLTKMTFQTRTVVAHELVSNGNVPLYPTVQNHLLAPLHGLGNLLNLRVRRRRNLLRGGNYGIEELGKHMLKQLLRMRILKMMMTAKKKRKWKWKWKRKLLR
jgi:hypothetical protein